MSRPRATLKDIAEATGFSANTVSLALRGSPRLPEATRERILKAAESLNYAPNRIAQSLASSATRTIGLVMTDILNPTLTLAAHTIERELSRAGYAVMFAASDGDIDREKRAIELFLSYQVDGMLVYPARRAEVDHIKAVDKSGTPVLTLVEVPGSGLDTVTIDDRVGAYRAFRHLIDTGHRRFAMFDGGRALGNLDKMDGAIRALDEASLPHDAITVLEPEGHAASHGYALMDRVIDLPDRPTALFATTDSLAIGALHWCRDHRVSVPGDLAVVGYDDTESAAHMVPPLTTINYAADKISQIGVARILQRLDSAANWQGPQTRLIEPDLIIRSTTGARLP